MKIGLKWRDFITRISPILTNELDSLITVLQAWSAKEHHSDGTHGAITVDSIALDDGTAPAPSLYFASDPDTGWYKATNGWALSINGTRGFQLDDAGLKIPAGGSAAAPIFAFVGDETTGLYLSGHNIAVACSGTQIARFLASGGLHVYGSLECESLVNDTGLAAGTYTPTITAVANCSVGGGYVAQYLRVGNTVTVSGKCDIAPTAATTVTTVGITLPVASNLSAEEHCAGTAACDGVNGYSARVLADATNDRATLQFISSDLANRGWSFQFTYQVI